MTENEAIKEIKENMWCDYCIAGCYECDIKSCSNKDAFGIVIKALEELQQYRAIGTLEELKAAMKYVRLAKTHGTVGQALDEFVKYEEIGTVELCRAAVEKQTAKKLLHKRNGHYCPICNNYFDSRDWKSKYCGLCSQKLDWGDEE